MKTCSKCSVKKELSAFSKRKAMSDGYRSQCKHCDKEYRELTKEYSKNYYKQYTQDNPEKRREQCKKYREKNKEKIKASQQNYRINNNFKYIAYSRKRQCAKKNRTPSWLTKKQLKQIELEYELASWCSHVMGSPYHVDHIVPLQGKTVSGLHVPWNLRVIPAKDNITKGNKFEQD